LLVEGSFAGVEGESARLELAFLGFDLFGCHGGGGGGREGFRVLGGRRPGGRGERPAARSG
jgi:hypothetical protein